MRTSEDTAELFAALGAMQADVPGLRKDKTATVPMKSGGKYTYRYVGLDTIIDHVRPHLAKHGLAVLQEVASVPEKQGVGISTRIVHASGQWLEVGPLLMPAGAEAQSYGSAATYGRRYSLSAALGIAADEDDDGAKAKTKDEQPAEKKAEPGGRKATQAQIKKLAVIAGEQGWDDEERRRRANVASFTDLTMRSASDLIEEWSKLPVPQDSPATAAVEGPHAASESEGSGDVARAASPASDAGEQDEREELWMKLVRYLGGDERAEERAREIAMEQIGTYDPDLKALGPLVTQVLREGIK